MTNSSRSLRSLAGIILALIALGLASAPARAAQTTRMRQATQTTRTRQAAQATVTAHPTRIGAAPRDRRLALELPLRIDATGLSRFATAVSTPGSAHYGQYASIPDLVRRFGASPAQRRQVTGYLHAVGATAVHVAPTGLFVSADLRVGEAERLFGTSLSEFHSQAVHGLPATRFLSPSGAAGGHVPRALAGAVTGVVGLDTVPLALERGAGVSSQAAAADDRPRAHRPRARGRDTATTSAYRTRTGTPAGCPPALAGPGFTPNQYLTAYDYNTLQTSGLDGQGERVALIEIDGFKVNDVKAFAACYGLAVPKINAFGVGIKKALPAGNEATLDLELLDAAAPRLSAIDVYESDPTAASVLKSLTDPLSNKGRRPDVISASLGLCEAQTRQAIGQAGISAVEQSLQLAAATGISVLAAAGDHGSTGCVDAQNEPQDGLAVNYPASSPWVTGVGGTNVQLDSANAIADPASDQIVWNDEPAMLGAGGGGISSFPRPSWQNGFVAASRREVPDVAMLADPLPGYEVYCTADPACVQGASSNPWQSLGGTSAGTPLLAGGFALVDQALRQRGLQSLGFADPLLYKIDRSSAASTVFDDVVIGSNDVSQALFGRALGCCSAATGYDQASGLGSIDLQGLLTQADALVGRQVAVGLGLPSQSRPVAAAHFSATVSCTGTCLMGAYARVQAGHGRPLTIYSQIYELSRRHSRTIQIPISAAERVTLRDALARHERITATIYGAIVDATGSVQRRTAGRALVVRG